MRILQVIDSLPTGGGARFVVNLAIGLNKIGIETDVLLIDGTETEFFKELKESNCNIYYLSKGKRWNLKYIKKISTYFKNYDLIHVHIFPTSYYVALANFFFYRKTPIVFTEHNSQNRRAVNFIFKHIEKFVYSQFSKVICLTSDVEKFIIDNLKINKNKLYIIENGVDILKINLTKAYLKSDFGFNEDDKLILMSARFENQKDHETIINAMLLLPEKFKLIFAGEGSKKEFYLKKVFDMNLEKRISFIGNRNDIYKIMKMVDYNVLSSHYEGLSLSAIEGLASGKPFLASNVSGLDFINNLDLLFTKGDYKELSKLILNLDQNEFFYNEIVKKCLTLSLGYNIDIMLNKYVKIYQNVINEKI